MNRTRWGSLGRIFVATALIATGMGVLPASAQVTPEPLEIASAPTTPTSLPDDSPAELKNSLKNTATPGSGAASLTPVDASEAPTAEDSGTVGSETSAPAAPSQNEAKKQPKSPETKSPAAESPASESPATKTEKRLAEPKADKFPESNLVVQKDNSLEGNPVKPGESFTYSLSASCESLTTDCVGTTLTDILPREFDVTSLPKSTNDYVVEFDEATRTLTITFKQKLQNPAGETGLKAGSTFDVEIGMRLPADTDAENGITVPNELTGESENTEDDYDDSDVTVNIPVVVKPEGTKSWPGSAVAGMDEESTITLGISNSSSSSAEVSGLELTEDDEDVFNYFDFTGATVTSFPEGADRVELRVKLANGRWVVANTLAGPDAGKLVLPEGIKAEDVVGVKAVFANANGKILPPSKEAGGLEIGVQARDFDRKNNEEILPDKTINVNNCAQVVANDKEQGLVKGKDACDDFSIFPSELKLEAGKTFYPDSNGNFKTDNGEHAVIGEDSGVSIGLTVKNASDFPIKEMVIYEPGETPGKGSEFEKFDAKKFKVEYPKGATTGVVDVTFADGSTKSYAVKNGEIIDLPASSRATGLKLTFTGVDDAGNPSIAPGTTAGFHIHGNLNEKANEEDLSSGTSPGISNCAHFTGTAGRVNGTGSAAADACQGLEFEGVDGKGSGVKDVGQTSVPMGQPIPFKMTFTNNGNVPLSGVTITDPRFDADGKPRAPNPFDQLHITKASVSGVTTDAKIQLYVPGSDPVWIDFQGATDAQLLAARGIRATLPGALPAKQSFSLHIVTERRIGSNDNVEILNCFDASGADPNSENVAVSNACAPSITTGPQEAGAGIEKVIDPKELPEFIAGMEAPTAMVTLSVSNEGNLSAKRLILEDKDEDFFNAFEFHGFTELKFPVGANRVQIDAFNGTEWVFGTPADKAALPGGVPNDAVRGIRAIFSSTSTENNGFVLTPCSKPEEDAAKANCRGELAFSVKLLEELRDPGTGNGSTVGTHENTLNGGYQTIIQGDGPDAKEDVGPTIEDIEVVPGNSSMHVEKTPDTTVAPGQKAPFVLKVTNTGNSNLDNLEVIDQLDEHMQLNEEFDGDGVEGHPYKLTFGNLPEGSPEPPQPDFTPVSDAETGKVTNTTWNFGDDWVLPPNAWVSLEIEVLLAAGVQAGDVVPNEMGAGVGNGDFKCTDPTGLNPVEGEEIDGKTYCTDTAELTTAAGAAFDSRKWVAGNPDLGWYHTWSGEALPVGDSTCPSTKDNEGVSYTAYPCIALVNPGDTYKYMLRVVNAGTEPAKQMRIIDQFPAQGDTGVHVNEDRGTEWNNRPVLNSVPNLTYKSEGGKATAELTNLYTNQEIYDDVCTKDLDLNPGAEHCAAGDWDAGFSEKITATQFRVAFDEAMQPGDTAQINFEMKTPLVVDQVNIPTIAWNSFAHAETTYRANGSEHVMPPTEPIKVGVGLSYGRLKLEKTIGENPGNIPLTHQRFAFQVTCTTQPVGAETPLTVWDKIHLVSSNNPAYITSLPAGASCEVYEIDAAGGTSSAPKDKPIKIEIKSALGQDPTEDPVYQVAGITNDFPLASLSVEKKVNGNAAAFAPKDYEVSLTCTFNGKKLPEFTGKTIKVTAGEKTVLTDVPTGSSCVMRETNSHGATDVTWDPAGKVPNTSAPILVLQDEEASVSVTNTFDGGTLGILKSTTGTGADEEFAKGPFTFSLVCTYEDKQLDLGKNASIELKGDGSAESLISDKVGPLPAGTECVVTETGNGGADETPAPQTVTIVKDEDKTAAFIGQDANKFSSGTISLSKALDGQAAGEAWAANAVFDIKVTCQIEVPGEDGPIRADVHSQTVSLKGGETKPLLDANGKPVEMPVGTHCFGEELVDGGATSHAIDFDSFENAAVITAQEDPSAVQELAITATNTFNYGSLALNKVVDGAAAGFVGDRSFELELTCALPNGTDKPTALDTRTVSIVGGQTVVVEKLPVGAECFATETNDGGASNTVISNADASNPAIVTGEKENPVTIKATNTFDAGQLTVKKHVVDGPQAEAKYNFTATCTTDFDDVVLPESDAAFALGHGESKVISVPTGAECQVVEETQIGNIVTTVVESDGENDGKVSVDGAAEINVTNTYLWGDLELVKDVVGDAANFVGDREFELDVTCRVPWIGENGALLLDAEKVSVTQDESALLEGLPQGTECWAVESNTGGASASVVDFDSAENHVVIADGNTVTVTATNTFDAASLTVKKTVVNGKPGPYDFTLTCTTEFGGEELAEKDTSFSLKHGEEKVVSVPVGAECKVVEQTVDGATVSFIEADGSNDGIAKVTEDSVIEVVNTFVDPTEPTEPTKPTEPEVEKPGTGGSTPDEPGAEKPETEKPGTLPSTGFQAIWIGLGGLLAVGAGIFLVRRRRA